MEKLIKEYTTKIESLENLYALKLKQARHNRNDQTISKEEREVIAETLANERNVIEAKRQCYVQFLKDLEDM